MIKLGCYGKYGGSFMVSVRRLSVALEWPP
jgi:hypothetical protein